MTYAPRPLALGSTRALDRAAVFQAAALLTGVAFVAADAFRRAGGRYLPAGNHFIFAPLLYLLVSAAVGAALWALVELFLRTTRRFAPRRRLLAACASLALSIGVAVVPVARSTFSGAKAAAMARWAVPTMCAAVALGWVLTLLLVHWALRRVESGRSKLSVTLALATLAVGGGLTYVDLTVYVALYARLHALLESFAALAWFNAFLVLVSAWVLPWPRSRRVLRGLALLPPAWLLLYAALRPARVAVDRGLKHVWLEPAYVGRVLGRVQSMQTFLANPRGWRGAELSRMDELKERFDLATTALDPSWDEPHRTSPAVQKQLAALRPERPLSIVVFYVDTLRYDAATDPSIMPNVAKFSAQSVTFLNAYAAGSDTLRSLPALTGGSYEVGAVRDEDVLRVAERSGMKTAVAMALSANEFLAKLRPSFRFQETLTVEDYARKRTDVWGYGADRATAGPMVDRALDYLRLNKGERFLLWLFNFDQHNWREIESKWVYSAAEKYKVPDEAAMNWRYRVVARAIDAEFGRLLAGIDSLGLRDDVLVLFVSDHGEALGRDGFWVHSIFLWESLVRVPLVMRAPGIEPRVVYEPVSLVDVAPTLTRYMTEKPPTSYHGEDLLLTLIPRRPPRRLPIVMAAASHETLLRVGIRDLRSPYKLVLPLESGAPELYDATDPDPDWVSVADEKPEKTLELLGQLVRSPVFPRSKADLDVREQARQAVETSRR
ncbi:MAG: sulfatase-like hydrolase/transferase [Polyangiaceae bacterium]